MNWRDRYWRETVHNNSDNWYNIAIMQYKNGKEQFLSKLGAENFPDLWLKQITEDFNKQIEEDLDLDQYYNAIADQLEQAIAQSIQNDSTSELDMLKQQIKSKHEELQKTNKTERDKFRSGYMQKRLDLYLSNLNISKEMALFSAGTNNEDISNNLYGYARRLIYNKITTGELKHSIEHYKTTLKGYFKEEAIYDGLAKVLENMGLSIYKTGSKTNDQGIKIKYDLIIGPQGIEANGKELDQIIQSLDSFKGISVEGTADGLEGAYMGIQSKSWIGPWEKLGNNFLSSRDWWTLGSYSNIPEGEDAYYWHAGIAHVMPFLIDIIGPGNFLYSTGGGFYWTHSILEKLKEMNYLIGYYKRKGRTKNDEQKIVSTDVSPQLHTD